MESADWPWPRLRHRPLLRRLRQRPRRLLWQHRPASPHPRTAAPTACGFPLVSVGDMVRAQRALLERLGVRRLAVVVGGSIGGLQALEWAVAYPDFVERAIVLAAGARLSAQGIALNEIGRRAIVADPRWQGGAYDAGSGAGRRAGHRADGRMLSYTSADDLAARFGRQPAAQPTREPSFGDAFDVESYLQYQGLKLVRRFDANSYLILTRAMDRYDLAEGRGSDAAALSRVRLVCWPSASAATGSFHAEQVRALADGIPPLVGRRTYREIDSPTWPRRVPQRVGPDLTRCYAPSCADGSLAARGPAAAHSEQHVPDRPPERAAHSGRGRREQHDLRHVDAFEKGTHRDRHTFNGHRLLSNETAQPATTRQRADQARALRLRDTGAARRPGSPTHDRRARRADLSDHLLRLRERRPRRRPLRAAGFGNIYTRIMNPTTMSSRSASRRSKAASAALATASGQAAELPGDCQHRRRGRRDRLQRDLYGGTYNLFAHTLPQLGINVQLRRCATIPKTSAPPSRRRPRPLRRDDRQPAPRHAGHSRRRRRRPRAGIPLIVDNTLPSPYLCARSSTAPTSWSTRPPSSSAATAPPSAASSSIAASSTGGQRQVPGLTEPDPSYHGVRYVETFGPAGLHPQGAGAAAARPRRRPSARSTLPLPARAGNAAPAHGAPQRERAAVAQFLAGHPAVTG